MTYPIYPIILYTNFLNRQLFVIVSLSIHSEMKKYHEIT